MNDAAAAASPCRELAVELRSTPPDRKPTPSSTRTGPMRLGSTAASASAAVGRIRAARRPAIQAARQAVTIPIPTAITAGSGPITRSAVSAPMPRRWSWWKRNHPSNAPVTSPTRPAASATTAASPSSSRRIWRGLAPTARSNASSRPRCSTDSPSVAATTKMASSTANPPKAPTDLLAGRPRCALPPYPTSVLAHGRFRSPRQVGPNQHTRLTCREQK